MTARTESCETEAESWTFLWSMAATPDELTVNVWRQKDIVSVNSQLENSFIVNCTLTSWTFFETKMGYARNTCY